VVGFLAGGVSDYHDVLVDPSADGAWDAIVRHLARRRATWDECYFEQLRRGSFLRDAPMSPGWSDERTTQELCLRVAVPPAGQPLGAAIPAHQLARLRKYRRRADKWGTMTFEAASELARAPLRDLFTLYEKRWAVKPSTSDAASPDLKFLQDDALLSPRDLAFAPEIHWIHLDGSPLAGLYALRSRSVLHCYLQAFDPSFADVSPGTLLVGSVLEHAHERGITAVDFLRGAEPYKARWGARGETNMARRIRPSGDGANARHRGPADGACFE
jgi:CelD/BcsL family acetyltransferase involved in cellulose biosynthesis